VRIVLDANVLLAGFGTRGLCEALLAVCLKSHQLVDSQHLLTETRRCLTTQFKVPALQADEIIAFLRDQAEMVKPAVIARSACRDPDDLPVLGTAVAGHAALLVTGDKDLLVLKDHAGIPIVTPRECYDRLR
jgi:putative PIN family toxin of toxin-antitoxin system